VEAEELDMQEAVVAEAVDIFILQDTLSIMVQHTLLLLVLVVQLVRIILVQVFMPLVEPILLLTMFPN
jgi:hypothetical protein